MSQQPASRCGYTWPADHEVDDTPNRQSCCYRETLPETDRCVWHTDETEAKSIEKLEQARVDPAVRRETQPVGELLDGATLAGLELTDALSLRRVSLRNGDLAGVECPGTTFSKADLTDADLSQAELADADFERAELTDAVLIRADLTGSNLQHTVLAEAAFFHATLTGANCRRTDLGGANFRQADLTTAVLHHADLTDANCKRADLTDAGMVDANLTDANFFSADLTGANLEGCQLSGAVFEESKVVDVNLRNAELTGADLRGVLLEDISVNANTNCDRLYEGETDGTSSLLRRLFGQPSLFDPPDWDAVARAYHDLKTAFAANGLVGKARTMHVRERRARSQEERSVETLLDRAYLRTLPARLVLGYGVRARTLGGWMLALFVVSTLVYIPYGISAGVLETITYSAFAFTAAPPAIPEHPIPQLVVILETFLGTLSTILLGYILGSRERFESAGNR